MNNIVSTHWTKNFDFYGWQDVLEVNGSREDYDQMIVWIKENISNPNGNVFWAYGRNPVFRFRKEKDQVFFMLRWS